MTGEDAKREAIIEATEIHQSRISQWVEWGRKGRWWILIIFLAIWMRGCLVEVSKTTFVGAGVVRDAVAHKAKEMRGPRQLGHSGHNNVTLPRTWEESVILKPGQARVLDLPSLTCGSKYDDRTVYIGDPVGGSCVEVYADGRPYRNCPEVYVDIPRKAKDWVIRNRSNDTLVVPVSITTARNC